MATLTPSLLEKLLNTDSQTCLSIFMPTEKISPASLQNPIRFTNLIKDATNQLSSSKLVNHAIKESLKTAYNRVDDADFWMHQGLGLAVFISEHSQLFLTLPIKLKEQVSLARHFHFKPLLPLLTTNGKYFVLSLSQSDVKLYEATRTTIDKRFLGDTPRSMAEFVDQDSLETHLGFHTTGKGRGASRSPIYHGQGGTGDENVKKQIGQFITKVESGISQILHGQSAPLILVGLDYITATFRNQCHYSHLLDAEINQNPESMTKESIHHQSWKIIRSHFKHAEKQALEAYFAQAGTGKTASNLSEILPAALGGRVHSLFVLRDASVYGTFSPDKNQVQVEPASTPENDDLLDLAVLHTLLNGGTAYSLKSHEMPVKDPIAALFRY